MSSKILLVLVCLATCALGILLKVQQDQIELLSIALREERNSLETAAWASTQVLAQQRLTEEALQKEVAGCNRMFTWYERCLDGRTCTEAEGEQLLLHRHFELPVLPDRRLPDEKVRERPPSVPQ